MKQLALGTTKTQFGITWSYVDPQYIQGLGLWRVYPGIPEGPGLTGLGAVLPIVSEQLSNETSIKVSFDIENLPNISATDNTSAFSTAISVMRNPILPRMAPASQTIVTIDPVRHVIAENKAVLYFNIAGLEQAEIVGHGVGYVDTSENKYKVTVKDYNNSNGVNIDSEAPMVDEVIGSTATFSFDINTLPKV